MPRFFLHLVDDVGAPDEEGVELSDLDAARARAIGEARALIGESVRTDGRIVLGHRIDIEDEAGRRLDSVYFRDAVRIDG